MFESRIDDVNVMCGATTWLKLEVAYLPGTLLITVLVRLPVCVKIIPTLYACNPWWQMVS